MLNVSVLGLFTLIVPATYDVDTASCESPSSVPIAAPPVVALPIIATRKVAIRTPARRLVIVVLLARDADAGASRRGRWSEATAYRFGGDDHPGRGWQRRELARLP